MTRDLVLAAALLLSLALIALDNVPERRAWWRRDK